ncbi:hypothetical protein ACFT9I_12930 [Streptomyces sp. NPDC057137]|uniref:hypothetical protein n=1 Tax=Streptomyces sp. NPDC057137 TaxID=3346030 RepID=UPI00362A1541
MNLSIINVRAKGSNEGGDVTSRNVSRLTERLRRLETLRAQVATASQELATLQGGGVKPYMIRIRTDLFHGRKGRRPSISKVSAPKGVNLQVYLLLLFEAQCRKRVGISGPSEIPLFPEDPEEVSWDKIVVSRAVDNSHGKSRTTARQNKLRQIKSAFNRLQEEGLVKVVPDPKRGPARIIPLHESGVPGGGDSYEYSIPHTTYATVGIPSSFFTEGWVYCLTPSEIHVYFTLLHLQRRNPTEHQESGVYCAGLGRTRDYGMSRDVYESHLLLANFGLIHKVRNPLRHEDGKVKAFNELEKRGLPLPAHRFRVRPLHDVFTRSALECVTRGMKWELQDRARKAAPLGRF